MHIRGAVRMKTILLIDDEPEVLEYLSEILRRHRYALSPMQDGPSALNLIRQGAFIDLVITNYRMPGMDGLQFVRQLRQVLPVVPVLMLTGDGCLESYCLASSLGVSTYVTKPIRAKELGRVVADVFSNIDATSSTGSEGAPLAAHSAPQKCAEEYAGNYAGMDATQACR